jgi:anti-anti-sigma factor
MPRAGMFDVERDDTTLTLTLVNNLHDMTFTDADGKEVLDLMNSAPIKNVVMDFHKADYFGSATLAFFIKLWKIITARDGRMFFCCLSEYEKDLLKITNLNHLCTICETRAEAVQLIRSEGAETA